MKKNTLIITVFVLLLMAFMAGCDSRSPVEPSMDPANVLKIVRITTSADSIYLDEGRTFAEISVYVENQDNDPVVGQTVYFQKNLGKLLALSSTDSYGIATATFSDDGEFGLATITAYVTSPTIGDPETIVIVDEASINVKIIEVPDVSNINIVLKEHPEDAEPITNPFINEVVYVDISAKDSQGENVPDGTVLTLRASAGFFQNNAGGALSDSTMVTTVDGKAYSWFNTGTVPGATQIFVRVGVYQQSKTFTIENIAQILSIEEITATPNVIYSDNNITFSTIKVIVRDSENYAASSVPVKFRTDLGRIINTVYTDSSGVARTTFWDDGAIGLATIEAVVKSYSTVNPETVISESSMSTTVTIQVVPD
ncbi:MAG: Ig-like domain-containing protein, partial [Candidatus Cloacimonetes bacterium]|nr:Ig-like domain-containing protein [Candidatus Cloacimonadota bacterium]